MTLGAPAGSLEDLRAAQAAFARAESALHAELQQLRAEQQALLDERDAALAARQGDSDRAREAEAEILALRAALDEREQAGQALARALEEERSAASQAQAVLEQQLAERDAAADRLRAGHAATQAEGARLWQSLQRLEAQGETSKAESAETLRRVRARADELERQLNTLRLERDEEVGALSRSLIERDQAHIQELAAVREHAQRQHRELLEHMASDGGHVQGLTQALEQRDQLIGSLSQRLVDSTAQTERVHQELEQLRAQLAQDTIAHEGQRQALIEAADQARRERERAHADQLSALGGQSQQREERLQAEAQAAQALAARLRDEHAQRVAALEAAHAATLQEQQQHAAAQQQALQAALQQREAELQEARAGTDSQERLALAAQARFEALAASHTTALQVLDEARETQRLRWMQQQHDQHRALAAGLQHELQTLAEERDALARELGELRQALSQALQAVQQAQAASLPALPPAAPTSAPMPAPAPAPAPVPAPVPPAVPSETAQPTLPRITMSDSPTADELLQLQDTAFVEAAYRAILGRPPEAAGLATHLAQLRQGVSKERLLVAMAASAEALQAGRTVPGLDGLPARLAERPERGLQRLVHRLWGRAVGVAEGPLAVVENRLGAQAQQGQGLMQQAVATLDRLGQHVARIDQRVQAIDMQLGRLRDQVTTTQAQGEALLPRLQALEGGLHMLLQRADAAEARLARLDDMPRTLQQQHVGLLLALGECAVQGPGAAAPAGEPPFDPAAVVRVRDMLQAVGAGR